MDEIRTACPTDEALYRFFRREAGRDEAEAFADHLLACPRCRLRLEALRAVEAEIRPRRRRLTALARRSLREQKSAAAAAPASRRRWAPAAAAALLLVMAATGVFLVFRPQGRTDPSLRHGRVSPLRLIEPAGRVTRAPEIFRWSAVPGADAYFFEMFDETLETVVPKLKVNDPRYGLSPEKRSALKPDRTYIWSVEAYGDDGARIEIARQSFRISGR